MTIGARLSALALTVLVIAALGIGARCMSVTEARCSWTALFGDGIDLDAPYLETRPEAVARMLALGEVGPGDYVIDLGTGDGRILIAAARDRRARGLGVDIDPVLVGEAAANAARAGVADRVSFRAQDLFETSLGEADVVTMFLLPEVNLRLRPRILAEMRPGARVVSHAFDMGDWRPDAVARVGGSRLYAWTVPARIDGRWSMIDADGRESELVIAQHFQNFGGSIRRDGAAPLQIEQGTIYGEAIRFVVRDGEDARLFEARARNESLESIGERRPAWRATRIIDDLR